MPGSTSLDKAEEPSEMDEGPSHSVGEEDTQGPTMISTPEPIKVKEIKQRGYNQWNSKESAKVCSYFKEYIQTKSTGSKGSLPGAKVVKEFIRQSQLFYNTDLSEDKKVKLIKTKSI